MRHGAAEIRASKKLAEVFECLTFSRQLTAHYQQEIGMGMTSGRASSKDTPMAWPNPEVGSFLGGRAMRG